jgi:PAS domain S-box-containing protein
MSEQKILILEIDPEPSKWLKEEISSYGLRAVVRPFYFSRVIDDAMEIQPDLMVISGDLFKNPDFSRSLMRLHKLGIPAFACRSVEQAKIILNSIILEKEDQAEKESLLASQGIYRSMKDSTFIAPSEFYRALVEDMPIMVARTAADGTLTYVNQHFCTYFGSKSEDLIGKNYYSFFPQQERELLESHYQSLTPNDPVRTYEVPITLKEGEVHWQRWLERAIYDREDKFIGLQTIGEDITDRIKVEDDLKRSRDDIAAVTYSSNQMLTIYNPQTILRMIIDQMHRMVPSENVGIYTIEGDKITETAYLNWYAFPEVAENAEEAIRKFLLPKLSNLNSEKNYYLVNDSLEPDPLMEECKTLFGQESKFFTTRRSQLYLPLVFQEKIIGVILLNHSQPGIFSESLCILARAIANNASMALANSSLYQQARTQATLLERLRLARELHDSVTQTLYSIHLYCDAARTALEAGRLEKTTGYLDEMHDLALNGTKELRMLIYELRPQELEELGLAGAIRSRLDAVERRCGLEAKLEVVDSRDLPVNLENDIFQIIQEGLNNIVKHANATHINIRLQFLPNLICLEIRDDGVGFNPREIHSGTGLRTIRERVEAGNGKFKVTSRKNKGTILSIEIDR